MAQADTATAAVSASDARFITSGLMSAVVLRERPPRAIRPGASGPRTLRGSCDRACGADRWAGVATVVPHLPQVVISTVNLTEVVSKLADAAQNLVPQSPALLARTGPPESTVEAMWAI